MICCLDKDVSGREHFLYSFLQNPGRSSPCWFSQSSVTVLHCYKLCSGEDCRTLGSCDPKGRRGWFQTVFLPVTAVAKTVLWAMETSFAYRVWSSYLIHCGILVPAPNSWPHSCFDRSSLLEFALPHWASLPCRFWQSWNTAVLEESKSRVPACWDTWSPMPPDSSAPTWSLFWR